MTGYSTDALRHAKVLGIGAGGLGSFFYAGLVRKGITELRICDEDLVEASNLNRQAYFERDLYKSKAISMAKNMSELSLLASTVSGHRVDFDGLSADLLAKDIDVVFVGVDNNQTRAFASRYFRARGIPVIFSAVNQNADYGYVFIQKAEGACIGCLFPDAMRTALNAPRICTSSPAVIDILQSTGALALYAADNLLMPGRVCRWTYRTISLIDGNDIATIAKSFPGCPLCAGA